MGRRKLFITGQILCLVCLVAVVVGCPGPVPTGEGLILQHTPFHPGNNQDVTFRINVNESKGVKEIHLYVYEYESYVDNGGASFEKRAGGKWGWVKTWNFLPPETNVDKSHTLQGFPANSYITYKALVITTDNASKEGEVSFAAGDWPWSNYAIPIYGHGSPENRIDICFVPDEDYNQDWSRFIEDMEMLVYDGYFLNEMFRNYHVNWRFYYTRNKGDAENYPSAPVLLFEESFMTNINVFAILHNADFRDARWGNVFTTEPVNIGTALHETGHAVFYLADEYCCDGGYWELEEPSNLYDTPTECQLHNRSQNWPENDCTEVTALGGRWYRPEPDGLRCIMRDDGNSEMRQFARTCRLRIIQYYGELASQ